MRVHTFDRTSRRRHRLIVTGALLIAAAVQTGCATSLVKVPFDMARYTAIQTATIPIHVMEIGATGLVEAMTE
jgi:hypothetical protein